MAECWLKTNHRTLLAEFVLPLLLLAAAAALMSFGPGRHRGLAVLAGVLTVIGLLATLQVIVRLRLPRLGYQDGMLLVYLRGSRPIRVPADIVEVFFRGQAPALIKRNGRAASETATIVIRLAESASQWHQKDVDPMLGQWCDGYIIVRGTWCEPINVVLLENLNRRLVEVHRKRRQEEAREA